MSKLEAMRIHSFRGLTDVTLDHFSKINLFVGENNAGKTSLLEAIYLIANYSTKQGFLRLARMREQYIGGLARTLSTEELISWLFSETIKPIKIEYEWAGMHKYIQCTLEEEEYLILNDSSDENIDIIDREQVVKEQSIEIYDNEDSIGKPIVYQFGTLNEKVIGIIKKGDSLFNCHFISAIDHRIAPLSPYIIDDLVKDGERPMLIEALRQFDKKINGIELLMANDKGRNTRPIPYIQHEDLGLVPISMFGDGVRKALVIASQAIRFKDGIILIDEIETGIHTKLIPTFFTWLAEICNQYNIQLFATTHSLEALDGMLKAAEADYNQLSVYRLGEDKKKLKYFSGERLKVLRYELGQDVR
ncbi:AAA family ATPase [Metasolibacillus sp. FSL K6-0083]|uniref:AAA family ATPase n=1 Tax=Metasolibacillus sp. FSL K6-0083 TaxID=2921416 RepID=UPI00315B0FF9